MIVLCGACSHKSSNEHSEENSLQKQQLQLAVQFTAGNLDSLMETQKDLSPSVMAQNLASAMSSNPPAIPDESLLQHDATAIQLPLIKYNTQKSSDPWQVVITGNDENGMLRIEGYGTDMNLPLFVQEVPCC